MPYELKDLCVDRVDLVDEGANSAAFIELYKRKETGKNMSFDEILSKMKPEHAEVIQQAISTAADELTKAREDLDAANSTLTAKTSELATANEALAKANAKIGELEAKNAEGVEKGIAFEETDTFKSMPEAAREVFLKMRSQKEAAEEQVRKNAEEKAEAEAIAKATTMKALPIEQGKLVGILKGCSPEVTELLLAASNAIEAAVLSEVGKNVGNGAVTSSDDAWSKLEKRAAEIVARDGVTKEKAVDIAISENPELYREYLNGGAN